MSFPKRKAFSALLCCYLNQKMPSTSDETVASMQQLKQLLLLLGLLLQFLRAALIVFNAKTG